MEAYNRSILIVREDNHTAEIIMQYYSVAAANRVQKTERNERYGKYKLVHACLSLVLL